MAISIFKPNKNKVSTNLSGYITYIYGAYKTGKTTLAVQMDGALLVAFEAGYHALPGVDYVDVTTWGEMKTIFREFKKPEAKDMYKAIVVDTIDVAADKCKKYICQQNGIEELGDLPYGKGWTKFKEEFNEVFRGLTQLGYAVFFIGHDKEIRTDDGVVGIRPALSNSTREVIAGMADIFGYAHQKSANEMSVLTLRDPSGFIECGCRFKHIPNEIKMNYSALAEAIKVAIETEAEENNGKFITSETIKAIEVATYDYDALMEEFQTLVGDLMQKSPNNGPKITAIVDRNLGKGKKVGDATPEQAEFIYLINKEIKEDLM